MAIAIRVQNLSKAYQLGQIGTGTLSRDLERWFAKIRGKDDPFLKIGEVNDRTVKSSSDIVWSLKDLNFEIHQGDAVGIIGRNGAGKSTLLKLLSRVTTPTTGNIKVRGRIASLLEVGTGFHPELSGRENIYLNGAILGMRKKEIENKFDEIVDFSGVERYIDTPVKRYSSGMYVRLAFAVSAYLESEILIVDEVLAVGDAEFQRKCLGKMGDVSKTEGRTVLFVSHNMSSILNLCPNSMLLQNGGLVSYGKTHNIISSYISYSDANNKFQKDPDESKKLQLLKAEILANSNGFSSLDIEISLHSRFQSSCSIDLRVQDLFNNPVGFASIGGINYNEMVGVNAGTNNLLIRLYTHDLALGEYTINVDLTNPNIEFYDRIDNCLRFEIIKNTDSLDKRHLIQEWNYGSYNIPLKLINNA